MAKRLNIALIYNMPVKGVEPGNTFTKHNMPHYVHKVFFQDQNGEIYLGEYITNEQFQNVFAPGVRQTFKVSEVQDKGDIIVPLMNIAQTEERTVNPMYLRQCNGETFSLAISIAKDLYNNSKPMQDLKNEDMDRILEIADKVDGWLVNKLTLRIAGL